MAGVTKERGIRELSPGLYEVWVSAGMDPVTGRYRRVSTRVHGGIRAARSERHRLLGEVEAGKNLATTATVNRLLDDWIEHLIVVGRAPKTIRSYRGLADLHIRPTLGPMPLRKLTMHDLERVYRKLIKDEKQSTAEHVHRAIRAALNQAVRWGWVDENVAERAEPPAIPYKEVVVPEPEEIISLIEAAESSSRPEMARFFFAASTTGLRRSELCALRLGDLNPATAVLTVSRNVTDLTDRGERKGPVRERRPKTDRGRRRLAVDPVTLAVLSAQVDMMADRAQEAGTRLVANHYFFSDAPRGDVAWNPDLATGWFVRLSTKLGLDHLTLHSLRKFMSTRALDSGADIPTVAARGGHSPAVLLRHYAGSVSETDHRAAAAVAALIAPKGKN